MITLRQSAIRSWMYCRAQYYAQYVLSIPLGLGDLNLDFGTQFHLEVEHYHKGEPYNETLLEGYTALYPPVGESEVPFVFKLGDDIRFTGVIDLMLPDETRDIKTSSTSYSQTRVDYVLGSLSDWGYDGTGLQATAYTYWRWKNEGGIYPFTFVIYRKDKPLWAPTKRIQTVTTTRTLKDMHIFEEFIYNTAQDIRAETEFRCTCRNKEHRIWEPTTSLLSL